MRLTFVLLFTVILAVVSSIGLNEEFTWTRITYRWPKTGPSKRQVQTETGYRSRGRQRTTPASGSSDPIIFDEETNAASVAKRPVQEKVPGFINYQYG